MIHDGQGVVTVMADDESIREVLRVLSKWFRFPVVNLEAIPDTRSAIRFERVPVAQVVDRLLRSAGLNYVILTNPETLVPTKVVAAPRMASSGGYPEEPRGQADRATPVPGLFRGTDGRLYQGTPVQLPPGAYDRPFRLEDLPSPTNPQSAMPLPAPPLMPIEGAPGPQPMPMPTDGAASGWQPMPAYQLYPSSVPIPEPANPQGSMPAPAPKTPAASRPGVMVPAPPTPGATPGGKPPGMPNQQ